jgi:hypothetical protein
MGVAQPIFLNHLLHRLGQARGETGTGKIQIGIEQREGAALLCQLGRGDIGMVAHAFRDACGHDARLVGVVLEAQHDQRVAQAGEAKADAALGHRFLALLLERPGGDVEDVVEHADRGRDDPAEMIEIECGVVRKGVTNEFG